MMNRKEFYEYVKDNVKEYLPPQFADADIQLHEIEKQNGVNRTALVIPIEGSNITPNVYLDSIYQEYQNGEDLDACVGDVADFWIEKKDMEIPFEKEQLLDYAYAKEKLQVRMCDPERNQNWLEGKAFTEQGDFAAFYTVNLMEEGDCVASTTVTTQLLDDWGIDIDTLHQDAIKADQNRGPVLYSMEEMLDSAVFGGQAENLLAGERHLEDFEQPMFCLTNEQKMNGASMILHEDIRKQVGEFIQGDFFVLPSSIHETLILPDNGMFDVRELNAMVKEINETQVEPGERLSDKVQFCDGKTAALENAEAHEAEKEMEKSSEKSSLHGKLEKAKEEIKSNDVPGMPKKMRDTALAM